MRTAAILPVKRFAQAKQRLSASVASPLRAELAQAMVADVLLALSGCPAIDLVIVVTQELTVAAAAGERGALTVEDSERGQSAAVSLGVRRAIEEGAKRVLCIPGDCPALDPVEIGLLLSSPAGASGREIVIVPDRHGTGTNGLLLCPPDAIAPSFGPGSCARHRELAHSAGAAWRIARPPSLLLDVDTGADLAALRRALAAETERATRTRAVLGMIDERTWAASHSAA